MTYPITPNPGVHIDPTAASARLAQVNTELQSLEGLFSALPGQILNAIVNSILKSLGWGATSSTTPSGMAADIEQALSQLYAQASTAATNISALITNAEGQTIADLISWLNDAQAAWTYLQDFIATGNFADLTAAFNALYQAFFGSSTSASLTGSIAAPQVANTSTSAQPVSNFPNAASVQAGGGWAWDGTTVYGGSGGSVKAAASGNRLGLRGVVVPVQPGQVAALAAEVQWSGLTYSGSNPIQLQIIPWNGTTAGTPAEVAQFASPAAGASWTSLSDSYTVPSSGVTAVQMYLVVTANATAGNVWWAACTTTISGGFLPSLQADSNNIIASFAPGGTSAQFVTGVTNLLALVGLTPSSVGGATNLTTLWTTIINDFINPLNAIEQSAISGLTALWNSIFGTTTPTTSSLLQPTAVANVLGGASLGADVSSVHTATTAAAAAATTAGTNASIAISSASAANTLAQGTIDGLNTAWSAGGTGNPVSSIPTIAAAIPTSAIVGGVGAAVAFGAVGGGNATTFFGATTASLSWSHTIATGDLGVLVFIAYELGSGASAISAVTYGGTAMTMQQREISSAVSGATAVLEVWWLKSPASGTKTVAVSLSGANFNGVTGDSVSYSASKVVAIGPNTGGGSTSLSMSAASATGHMVVGAFANVNGISASTLSAYSQTQRYNNGSTDIAIAMGDAAGSGSVSFTATSSGTAANIQWSGITVDLSN